MPVSLIVKWKYKWTIRDYYTLKQFETYINGGERPAQTWRETDTKRLANKKQTLKKKLSM